MDATAAHYLEAMRSVQPEGPYQVAGWSLGGIVALEIAQQLRAQGQEVGLLGILDAPVFPVLFTPPELRAIQPEDVNDAKGIGRFSRRLGFSLEHLLQFDRARQGQLVLEQARQANLVPPDITLADFARWVEIVKANYRALVGYQVRPYPGPITVFRATGNDPRRVPDQGPDLGWGKVSDRVEVVAVPGDHKSILRKPNVQVLAERLRAALRGQRASACERSRANAAAP
jgi:thioesterase domain-containing protein